jgi:hypothetical protein
MSTKKYQTNLKCDRCVAAITPHLNADERIKRWSVDLDDPMKTLTVEGDQASDNVVAARIASAGYRIVRRIDEAQPSNEVASSAWKTYFPLLLVLALVLGFVGYLEWLTGVFIGRRAMQNFMGGFFVIFAFFKLLDVRGFADAFQSYDVAARRFRAYAIAYPWIELTLGVAYLTNFAPAATSLVTLIIMGLGLIGVTQALLSKRKIQCACLGSVFKLPMSKVTFVEDSVMAAMALLALIPLHI